MKTSQTIATVVLALALSATGATGAMASDTSSSNVSASSEQATSGEAIVQDEATGEGFTTQAKKSPGGGTWNFGSEKVTTKAGKQKKCYSHYFHRTKRHSGSAIIGSVNVTKTASKGKWANANAYGKRSQTCKTKWSANA